MSKLSQFVKEGKVESDAPVLPKKKAPPKPPAAKRDEKPVEGAARIRDPFLSDTARRRAVNAAAREAWLPRREGWLR